MPNKPVDERPAPKPRLNLNPGGVPFGSPRVKFDDGGLGPSDPPNLQLNYGPGPVLPHARVRLIFWGTAWKDTSIVPNEADIASAVLQLIQGPYFSGLAQYGGLGAPSLAQVIVLNEDPPNPCADFFVQLRARGLIDQGAVPRPDQDPEQILCFVLPQGVKTDVDSEGADAPVRGYHTYLNWYKEEEFGFEQAEAVHYAVILNDQNLDGITDTISHELVETITDPEANGLTVLNRPDQVNEISDICNGYQGTVNGVLAQAYWSAQDNACIIPGVFRVNRSSGFLVQGTFAAGNLELVLPTLPGHHPHAWVRIQDAQGQPWVQDGTQPVWPDLVSADNVCMIQSNLGYPGNLEVIAQFGGNLFYVSRNSTPDFTWSPDYPTPLKTFDGNVISGFSGNPALIQSTYGTRGDFHLIVPLASGGVAHYSRDNANPGALWYFMTSFATEMTVDAVALLQSNGQKFRGGWLPSDGFIAVLRSGNRLFMATYAALQSNTAPRWSQTLPMLDTAVNQISGVGGTPALIQSSFGNAGNFEMVIPNEPAFDGLIRKIPTLLHYYHNNDTLGQNVNDTWIGPVPFGYPQGVYPTVISTQTSMVQSITGELVVVSRQAFGNVGHPPAWNAYTRGAHWQAGVHITNA